MTLALLFQDVKAVKKNILSIKLYTPYLTCVHINWHISCLRHDELFLFNFLSQNHLFDGGSIQT